MSEPTAVDLVVLLIRYGLNVPHFEYPELTIGNVAPWTHPGYFCYDCPICHVGAIAAKGASGVTTCGAYKCMTAKDEMVSGNRYDAAPDLGDAPTEYA